MRLLALFLAVGAFANSHESIQATYTTDEDGFLTTITWRFSDEDAALADVTEVTLRRNGTSLFHNSYPSAVREAHFLVPPTMGQYDVTVTTLDTAGGIVAVDWVQVAAPALGECVDEAPCPSGDDDPIFYVGRVSSKETGPGQRFIAKFDIPRDGKVHYAFYEDPVEVDGIQYENPPVYGELDIDQTAEVWFGSPGPGAGNNALILPFFNRAGSLRFWHDDGQPLGLTGWLYSTATTNRSAFTQVNRETTIIPLSEDSGRLFYVSAWSDVDTTVRCWYATRPDGPRQEAATIFSLRADSSAFTQLRHPDGQQWLIVEGAPAWSLITFSGHDIILR